jgi:hypothetical protein
LETFKEVGSLDIIASHKEWWQNWCMSKSSQLYSRFLKTTMITKEKPGMEAHVCNPSYSEGGDPEEAGGSRRARAKSL